MTRLTGLDDRFGAVDSRIHHQTRQPLGGLRRRPSPPALSDCYTPGWQRSTSGSRRCHASRLPRCVVHALNAALRYSATRLTTASRLTCGMT